MIRAGAIANSRRAFTMVELIVGFTLTALLFALMYQFLIPALKISTRTTERAQTQQQAVIALKNLAREVETTSMLGITPAPDGRLVAIHPVAQVTQNSERVYADHLVVYRFVEESNQVHRALWRGSDDPSISAPRKLSVEELEGLEAGFVDEGRVLIRGVELFEFTHSGTGELLHQPFKVRLKMQKRPGDGAREFELVQAISLRNQI